jgi:hypothetical protein
LVNNTEKNLATLFWLLDREVLRAKPDVFVDYRGLTWVTFSHE